MDKRKIKNTATIIIFSIMIIISATLALVLLANADEYRNTESYNLSLTWYIIVTIISTLSIVLLFLIQQFDNRYIIGAPYPAYASIVKHNWYFKAMFVFGVIAGFSFAVTHNIESLSEGKEVFKYSAKLGEYLLIIWSLITGLMLTLNIINFQIKGFFRSIIFLFLGLGFFLIGAFFATLFLILLLLIVIFLIFTLIFRGQSQTEYIIVENRDWFW